MSKVFVFYTYSRTSAFFQPLQPLPIFHLRVSRPSNNLVLENSCSGNFKTVIMQLPGTQLKHYQLSKFCYQKSIFIHRWESAGSQNGLSKKALQMSSPNYNLVESVGGLLGLCWVSVGSLISPWNTISFQSSSQNGLSKKALQMSSPNELFKLRPV